MYSEFLYYHWPTGFNKLVHNFGPQWCKQSIQAQNHLLQWNNCCWAVNGSIGVHKACCHWVWLPDSEADALLNNLCFLRLSWHGVKKLCVRASSAVILHLWFTVKHLSTRSKRDWGICSRNSGLFVFREHQCLSSVVRRNCTSSKHCSNKATLTNDVYWNISDDEKFSKS